MGTLIVVGLIFAAAGALFAGIGIATARSNRRFEAQAARAQATVTDVRARSLGRSTGGGLVHLPVVRFETADGRTIEAEVGGGTNVQRWQPGQAVEVRYDPADPTDVRLPGSGSALIQGVFLAIGTLFAVIGLLLAAVGVVAS